MYAIIQQPDASENSRRWAEWANDDTIILHRTRRGAMKALRTMVPADRDPWVFGGYRVIRITFFVIGLEVD